jgi:hypothetical protein
MRQCILLALFAVAAGAQTKAPAPQSEWGKWESIRSSEVSPNGEWLAYGIDRSNGNHEVRIAALKEGKNQVIAFGEAPAFSKDSQWLACLIGIHEDQEAKLRKDKKPIRKKLTLLKLATGETTTFENIESFAFSKSGAYLRDAALCSRKARRSATRRKCSGARSAGYSAHGPRSEPGGEYNLRRCVRLCVGGQGTLTRNDYRDRRADRQRRSGLRSVHIVAACSRF